MTIKMIIFDLDGVLVDACEWHRVALNEALNEVCGYEISLKDHYSTFNGIPTRKKLQKLTEQGILSIDLHDEVYNKKQRKTVDIIESKASIREEKIQMIKGLKDGGFIVTCFTNSIRMTAEMMLMKTGIIDMFDDILTNEDVITPKPDPEGYIKIIKNFSMNPSEVLIVEDSPKGKKAAYSSGANVLEVTDPSVVTIDTILNKIHALED